MIKICSPQLGISPNSSLGGETYDYQILKGFTEKGIKVFVYLPKNRYYDKSLKNFHVTYAPITHIFPPVIFSFLCLPYLVKTYKKENFGILRIHSPRFLGIAAIIFKKKFPNVKILASAVTVDDSKLFFPIEKALFKAADAIIVQSEYMKQRTVKRYDIKKEKIYVTYGGLLNKNLDRIKKPKEAKYIKKEDFVIVFMGIMIKRKNPMFLLKVYEQLRQKFNNIKIIFIGDGPERTKIINDENILLIKSAYGGEKNYWFERMDLFVLPSFDEGFGLAATEAMSFGKVVITSKAAAFPEIIDNGIDGFCLDLDVKKWVIQIATLIKDKKGRDFVGKRARKKVQEKFNWQKTYDLNERVIEGLVK